MTFKRPPARPAKRYDGKNPSAPRAAACTRTLAALDEISSLEMGSTRNAIPARPFVRARDPADAWGKKIRESARGEPCTVRLVGVCSHDPAKSIWSHARWGAQLGEAGRGMATKALDLCGAIACTDCDAAFDQHRGAPHLTREQIDLDWMMGHLRSLAVLQRKGLL